MNTHTLMGESMLAIIAGSDTTSTALANLVFYLLSQPECFVRLRQELDIAAGDGAAYDVEIEAEKLVELKYLQAIINETLRLQPAVPNGVQRMVPDNGEPAIILEQYVSEHFWLGIHSEFILA